MLRVLAPKPLLRAQYGQCAVELYHLRALRQLKADALIVPSNRLLWMGARVLKRVRDEAGNLVEEEARQHAPLAPGAVATTSGGMLRVRHIVHVNVFDERQVTTRSLLHHGLDCAFKACSRLVAMRVMIPDFTDQLQGWNASDCARIVVESVRRNAQAVQHVLIACWDASHAEAYRAALT